MGIVRPKPYNLKWPLTSTQVEGMDEMFLTLFKATRALQETVVAPVTSTLTSSTSVLGNIGSVVGQIGVRPSKQADEDSSSSSWPVTGINTPPSALFTQGSVIFAGPSGVLAQDNVNLFWDTSNKRLGIGTITPSATLHIGGAGNTHPYWIAGSNGLQIGYGIGSTEGLAFWENEQDGSTYIASLYDNTAGTITFVTHASSSSNNLAVMTLKDQNVGIGTLTPLSPLDVRSNITNFTSMNSVQSIHVANQGPYIAAFYNDTKSTTIPNMAYFGFDNGDFSLGTFTGKLFLGAGGAFALGATTRIAIDNISGNVGIGLTVPTALLHLKAGTAAASTAPLKLTSGVSLATAEAGAIEFTTDDFFATITTGVARKAFILDNGSRLTSGKIPIATTNGRLIDSTTSLLIAAGFASVVASTFEKSEIGTDANILTYTTGAADEALNIQVMTDVSAITGTSIVVTITWKDSNNTTATSILTLTAVGDGTINVPINAFTATNVVISTVFVGVSTAYKISAIIVRLK